VRFDEVTDSLKVGTFLGHSVEIASITWAMLQTSLFIG